jgi:hypothetical protein
MEAASRSGHERFEGDRLTDSKKLRLCTGDHGWIYSEGRRLELLAFFGFGQPGKIEGDNSAMERGTCLLAIDCARFSVTLDVGQTAFSPVSTVHSHDFALSIFCETCTVIFGSGSSIGT